VYLDDECNNTYIGNNGVVGINNRLVGPTMGYLSAVDGVPYGAMRLS
ncbi:hypothetical protein A2U01_0095624, partial [Trifolium medium]|nr:hypothetical protein [Trifolium medium]